MTSLADIELVLASTSRYRRELLTRLTTNFRTIAPQVDEAAHVGEPPEALATRLAFAKTRAVADSCVNALVIGSDQVAELDGRALGKPGTAAAAWSQLAASSGRRLKFHTALCLIDTRDVTKPARSAMDVTQVVFRDLGSAEIARYVAIENPLDCAGSFKVEGLGISLFDSIESHDPTALIGLPLIALSRLLREAGIALP